MGGPRLLVAILAASALLFAGTAPAEFYRWTDADGRVRVSNVPRRGVRADGSIAPGFHPASIAAQRAALRARLGARDAELAGETHSTAAPTTVK